MRSFKRIILHCTATQEGGHYDVATIRDWHVKGNGWSDIGYHYVIYLDGTIHEGRPVSKMGSHTKRHNEDSIGVVYVGGLDKDNKPKDTMTVKQELAFLLLVRSLRTVFGPMTIHGHNEFSSKACPSFEVRDKYKFLIIPKDAVSY